jgi:hypothetical protein
MLPLVPIFSRDIAPGEDDDYSILKQQNILQLFARSACFPGSPENETIKQISCLGE